jgi:recombination protein RecT
MNDTESNQTASNQLLQQAQGAAPQVKKPDLAANLIDRIKPQLETALARIPGMSVDKTARVFLSHIRLNPKLLECTTPSLLGAFMQSAKDGLEPGLDGECYLIPRWSGKLQSNEVTYQRGYQGILKMAYRSGEYKTLPYARAVHENDLFEYEEGSNPFVKYKRAMSKRGAVIGYFAHAVLITGQESFTISSLEEMEAFRDKFAASKKKDGTIWGPWADHFDEMAKKTVLKSLLKYLPKSSDDMRLLQATDEKVLYEHEVFADPIKLEAPKEEVQEVEVDLEPLREEAKAALDAAGIQDAETASEYLLRIGESNTVDQLCIIIEELNKGE